MPESHQIAPSDWRAAAACADTPDEWWFPRTATGEHDDVTIPYEAALLCAVCTVRAECLAYAVEHEAFGVWAGTSAVERHRLRRYHRLAYTTGARP
jgi:WhiB family redox-sensing transcriptional regulator